MKKKTTSEEERTNATRELYNTGALCNWMDRTFAFNNYKWLVNGLKKIINKDRKFSILSPSANKARYEYETYLALKNEGYPCEFIVSDLNGRTYYQNSVDEDGFIYIREDQEAKKIILIDKVDLICDFKGAIWYVLKSSKSFKHIDLIQNLEAFSSNLKDDDSKFIVDIYKYKCKHIHSLLNYWNYAFKKGKTIKKSKYQEEISTGSRLEKYFKRHHIVNRFRLVEPSVLNYREISLYFITKKDLDILISDLKGKYGSSQPMY